MKKIFEALEVFKNIYENAPFTCHIDEEDIYLIIEKALKGTLSKQKNIQEKLTTLKHRHKAVYEKTYNKKYSFEENNPEYEQILKILKGE